MALIHWRVDLGTSQAISESAKGLLIFRAPNGLPGGGIENQSLKIRATHISANCAWRLAECQCCVKSTRS
jgi:hypothetical protein